MSNGIWTGSASGELLRQSKLIRHRLLIVSPGTDVASPWPGECASGFASLDPNTIAPGTVNPNSDRGGPEGGPHFVMSGETPDESHTYGFEFTLFTRGLGNPANPATGDGYDVTIWVLISNTQQPGGTATPIWTAMASNLVADGNGINADQLWHSFDVNAEAVRFQFGNLIDDPSTVNESIGIAFSEL